MPLTVGAIWYTSPSAQMNVVIDISLKSSETEQLANDKDEVSGDVWAWAGRTTDCTIGDFQ
jgi:hypothetical protein